LFIQGDRVIIHNIRIVKLEPIG